MPLYYKSINGGDLREVVEREYNLDTSDWKLYGDEEKEQGIDFDKVFVIDPSPHSQKVKWEDNDIHGIHSDWGKDTGVKVFCLCSNFGFFSSLVITEHLQDFKPEYNSFILPFLDKHLNAFPFVDDNPYYKKKKEY